MALYEPERDENGNVIIDRDSPLAALIFIGSIFAAIILIIFMIPIWWKL
jgi:hypothetical protein